MLSNSLLIKSVTLDMHPCLWCAGALVREDSQFYIDGVLYGLKRRRFVCTNGHSTIVNAGVCTSVMETDESQRRVGAGSRLTGRPRGITKTPLFVNMPRRRMPLDCSVCFKALPEIRGARMEMHTECVKGYMKRKNSARRLTYANARAGAGEES